MRSVKIITDSCSDLGCEIRKKYNIDYVHMNTEYDGRETSASLDWEYYTPKELYDIMRDGNRVLTTQVPVEEFRKVFSYYLENDYDIVYVGCSLKQSGSVNTGSVVSKELLENYPNAEIYCIDSLNASMGEGMLAIRAAEYQKKGMTAKEIANRVSADRNLVNEYCTVHTLDALKRSGRLKASAAFFGNLFGVKPIIISDADGYQTPIKKVKGRKTSMQEIVKLLKENIINSENQTIYIAHSDCLEEALELKQMVEKEIRCADIYLDYIGPIIGASVGPDTLAVFGFGKEVTFRCNE